MLGGSIAFEHAYATYGPQIYRYVARRLGPDLAEDITAQTFAEAWAGRERFDSTLGEARAWIFGIATNLIRRHYRAEERQLRAYARSGPDAVDIDGADDVDRLSAAIAAPGIAAALLELRAVDRDLFWLHATTELTYAELAEVTCTPIGTVRSRLSRTRDKLQAALDDPDQPRVP